MLQRSGKLRRIPRHQRPVPKTDTRSMSSKEMYASAGAFLLWAVLLQVTLILFVTLSTLFSPKMPPALLFFLAVGQIAVFAFFVGSILMVLYGRFTKK